MPANHGKFGNVFRMLKNGFSPIVYGVGLNDLTWGASDTETDSSFFEVEIDGTPGTDTFKWRENGGGYTTGVVITGSSQALSGANMNANITFAATTGHTVGDKWSWGSYKDEPTTINGNDAQITDAALRNVNPNATIVVSPANSVNLKTTDHATGTFHFDGAPGVTTVSGDDGFIPTTGLQKVGFLFDWSLDLSIDMHDLTVFQDDWQTVKGGIARFTGQAQGFEQNQYWNQDFLDQQDLSPLYHFLQLFDYDPDDDRTGSHWDCWVTFPSYNVTVPINEYVKEIITFEGISFPAFTANA